MIQVEKEIKKIIVILMVCLSQIGCATWSSSTARVANGDTMLRHSGKSVTLSNIVVTEDDIINRKYIVLGDIEATVRKTTIFNEDPTKAQVNEKLKQEAAALGADAVIMIRYGELGISHCSYGSLNGKGRAVAYND